MNKYVLAMYDIRGKQKFIYRSGHLKEIQGASLIIEDLFDDYLYPAARAVRDRLYLGSEAKGDAIRRYDRNSDSVDDFCFKKFERRMEDGTCLGETVYDGGGNFLVLFKNAEICRLVTTEFSKRILRNIQTLKVLCSYKEDVHPEDFEADRTELYRIHRYNENQEISSVPYGTLPIVMTDPITLLPFTSFVKGKGIRDQKVTAEGCAKYKKYWESLNNPAKKKEIASEKFLDRLVENKGEESLLAVIYIDGNNMGAKVAEANQGKKSYDECVNNLRTFSKEIQKIFIDDRLTKIDQITGEKKNRSNHALIKGQKANMRLVLGAGDEITIICNARDALEVVRNYLKELPKGFSSCAGISVFHSHAPFADAYRIAEECCENGKVLMKQKAEKNPAWKNACMLDFQFNQGMIGASLEEIRRRDNTEEFQTPWLVCGNNIDDAEVTIEMVESMAAVLRIFGRSNAKGLLEAAQNGEDELNMEIQRICGHMDTSKREKLDMDFLKQKDLVRKLIIQMMPVYDIWFAGEETGGTAAHEESDT